MERGDEETAFNVMISRDYTDLLICVMNENEGLLPLHIVPIRRMLSAGRKSQEINYDAWGEYFEDDFRVTENLSHYYETIDKIRRFEPYFKLFEYLDKMCNLILSTIREKINKEK